jgi:hypothetical protein
MGSARINTVRKRIDSVSGVAPSRVEGTAEEITADNFGPEPNKENVLEKLEVPEDKPLKTNWSAVQPKSEFAEIKIKEKLDKLNKNEGELTHAELHRYYQKGYSAEEINKLLDKMDPEVRKNTLKYMESLNEGDDISPENIATFSRANAKRWAKSARIQMARERLGAVHRPNSNIWGSLAKKYATPITYKQHRTISWLSPSGELYDAEEFGGSEHRDWIKSVLEQHGDKDMLKHYKELSDETPESVYDEIQFMEDQSFAKINTMGGNTLEINSGIDLTKQQNKTLQDLAIYRKYTPDKIYLDGMGLDDEYQDKAMVRRTGLNKVGKLKQRIAGLGFRERILNWLKEQPRFKSFDPDSSFVGTVKYDQDNQSMQIELNGKKYDFCNVEERLFDSFSGAGSKGAFFNREIKSLHNCGAW